LILPKCHIDDAHADLYLIISMQKIHYYITAHGYGHGVRSCDIVLALAAERPDLSVCVTTNLPEAFLRPRLKHPAVTLRSGGFDVGMAQKDSIRIDLDETLKRLERLRGTRRRLIENEAAFLRSSGASVVVCDIPAIPIEAAKMIGLPALAIGNFSWDWIYDMQQPSGGHWDGFARMFEEGYAQADALLRLPFSCPMPAFGKIMDMPMIALPGRVDRERLAVLTGADPVRKWVLLSFTTLDWDSEALRKIEAIREYEFFSVLPLAWPGSRIRPVDPRSMSFPDLLASCDIVVTKPGFGILSDCVVNRKPMVYSERDHFAEFKYLATAIERHLVGVRITQETLYDGDIEAALRTVEERSHEMDGSEPLPTGGAAAAAKVILDAIGLPLAD